MKAVARTGVVLTLAASIAFLPAAPAMAAVDPKIATAVTYPDWSPNLQPQKASQLWIDLWNDGDEIATGVTGTLSSSDSYIDVVDPGPRTFTDIEVKNEVTPSPNDEPFGVAVGATEECAAHFELAVSTDQGDFVVPFEVPIEPCTPPPSPRIDVGRVEMIDANSGDVLEDLLTRQAVELRIDLQNNGELDSDDVSAVLTSPEGNADITDATGTYGPIPKESSATGVFALTMTECDPLGLYLELEVEGAPTREADNGTSPLPQGTLPLTLQTRCPGTHLLFTGSQYDDTEGGNGDGVPQPGETISIRVEIENDGADVLSELVGTFEAEHADVLQATSPFPPVAPRERVVNSVPFVIRIHDDAPTITIGSSEGCFWHTFGTDGHRVDGETELANAGESINITGPDGSVTNGIGAVVGVCAVQMTDGGGDPLPETGSSTLPLTAVGTSFVIIGRLMRRRAARRA